MRTTCAPSRCLSLLLLSALWAGCSGIVHYTLETGELSRGSTMAAKSAKDNELQWSIVVGTSDINLRIGKSTAILEGYGTREGLQYSRRRSNPPEYTFTSKDRPRVFWFGYLLRIGEQSHDLSKIGVYLVAPDGSVNYQRPGQPGKQ